MADTTDTWYRFRFQVPGEDGRPMEFPSRGPFWITGHSDTHTVVVAYAKSLEELTADNAWPDAERIEDQGPQPIIFSSRFPRPEWWKNGRHD